MVADFNCLNRSYRNTKSIYVPTLPRQWSRPENIRPPFFESSNMHSLVMLQQYGENRIMKIKTKVRNIDELLDSHKEFAEEIIKKDRGFTAQAVICTNGNIIPIIITGGNEQIKQVLKTVEKGKNILDWMIMMHEGYQACMKDDDIPRYVRGSLEERYLSGDAEVKWVFVIQALLKEGKRTIKKVRIYEIKHESFDFILEHEIDEYDGYLAI